MPYITYRGNDENGMPALYVGDEKIEGVLGVDIEHSVNNNSTIEFRAILLDGYNPVEKEKPKEKESKKGFTFKEGITGG